MESHIQIVKETNTADTSGNNDPITSYPEEVKVKILTLEYNNSHTNSGEFDYTENFSDLGSDIDKLFVELGIDLNEEQKRVLSNSEIICPEIVDSIIQSIDNIKEQLSGLSLPYQSISINPSLDPEISNYFLIEIEINMKFNSISDLVDLWEKLNTKCIKFSHPYIALFVNLKSVD
ncbi:MAG: hypothetical protein M1462_01925 [Candidatus Thermoplasmatota archaeon]|uniref:hypothetical protein n=1 Tax=Ferroplasma sp. TaxID=2591003 RepID=UPI002625B6ED|nr:hypothetical protein [Ferroplasma sp.]MCL4311173.1 hypothetical protein [Candidatus Thermoplasmatota archaeon]